MRARAASQSVKLVRNALAVFCVECGTICSWLARRHEVAQRWHALWPAATAAFTGRIGPALLGSAEMPVRPSQPSLSQALAVDTEATPQIRIHADPSAAVHAVGLVRTGHEEDQPNARVFNKISETINQIIAATVRDEQRPAVI